MQLEDYVAACEDFTDALRSNPSSRAASEALRDAVAGAPPADEAH